ncbi:hypothetical protein RHMOL_Rhmol04G0340200 [Rhododendron molle]|uniref:Uncharacterized protein n=1 Tax=Rhododendron molle TaxID=49168 RepID=A0ACC0P7B0_RHOML|nr:hypothetical protein RHMOL_Rhmol04G0340200 [Rhododendron molle]
MDQGQYAKGKGSVHLQIDEPSTSSPTILRTQSSIEPGESNTSSTDSESSLSRPQICAIEKKITLFALRLAVLEKTATGLGTLGFIWATVVLLGGFALPLDKTDFWFISIILLIEGTRIFSRSHELEWQHQATWSVSDVGINSFRAIRSKSNHIIKTVTGIFRLIGFVRKQNQLSKELGQRSYLEKKMETRRRANLGVPFLPYVKWFFESRNISKLFYWLQLVSATTCAVLSLTQLIRHNYGQVPEGDANKRNLASALNIFYALALAEAMLFLLEKGYWEYQVTWCKVLDEVNEECELGPTGMVSIKRFFYDVYSRCVNGSIFDGLKMDMVSFSMELIASQSEVEQLIGCRILHKFATNLRFSDDTLQKLGISLTVVERLVEMLNWTDPEQEEIRQLAAEILSKLAGKKQNSLRVSGIPGAMQSISSLLLKHRTPHIANDELPDEEIVQNDDNYRFWTFNHLGLLILKKLAHDHDNCGKIGNTRGLLRKIIDFTHTGKRLLKEETVEPSQILTVKRSLQLLKMLASTTGAAGEQLRKEISEVVFTISNIRDILRYGENYKGLQQLGIGILTSLAMEEDAKERIGETGGVLKVLFNIFFKQGLDENQKRVRTAAGEALAMLAVESKSNCHRIIKLKVIENLVDSMEVPLVRINAARILTNLCTFSGDDSFMELRGVTAAAPTVLRAIMSEENKLQEAMVGLAPQIFKFMTAQESSDAFHRAGIQEAELATTLMEILKKHRHPSIKTPRIRIFVLELAIWMMLDKETNIQVFKDLGMKTELEWVMETSSELESFNVFCGTIGLSRCRKTIHLLVETATKLLEDE